VDVDQSRLYDDLRERYGKVPAHVLLGLSLENLGPGRADVRMQTTPSVINPNGQVHGGVLGAMIHTAVLQAARTQLQLKDSVSTIELKVNYMLPAEGESFICTAEMIRMGGSIGVCEARLRDAEGATLAVAIGTVHVKRHREP
jgi:uncharacterized protein (TIGR00369 family)